MILSPLSEAHRKIRRQTGVSGPSSSSRVSRYSRFFTIQPAGSEELLAAERGPGQEMLPSPLRGARRVRPRRGETPSVRMMSEQDRLAGGQISQSARGARDQCEGIAEARCFIKSRAIGGIAA